MDKDDWDMEAGSVGEGIPREQRRTVLSVSMSADEFETLAK